MTFHNLEYHFIIWNNHNIGKFQSIPKSIVFNHNINTLSEYILMSLVLYLYNRTHISFLYNYITEEHLCSYYHILLNVCFERLICQI